MGRTIQRWSMKHKGELEARGRVPRAGSQAVGIEGRMDTFVNAGEPRMKANAEDEAATRQKKLEELWAEIGELVLELGWRDRLRQLVDGMPRPVKITAAGYLIVAVFGIGAGVALLAGASPTGALIVGGIVAWRPLRARARATAA